MKYILYISLLFVNHDINYREIFNEDYTKAIEFISENRDLIEKVCLDFENDPAVISSIVFPEAIRYSMIRDFLESTSLDLVYVSTGTADFSIGSFQIKPSFAERIEYYAMNDINFQNPELIEWFRYDEGLKDFQIRRERIDRLNSTEGQLIYVNYFYSLLLDRFSYLNDVEMEYLIKFSSTAYNHNFEADQAEIELFMEKSFFPWGVNNEKEKYNYADIAWDYYARISEEIVINN